MIQRLNDRIAIVTGSTSGLGAAIAQRLAAEGASVIVTGRSEERGKAVSESILSAGGEAAFVACDLTQESSIEALARAAIERYGRVTTLVTSGAATATNTNERGVSITDLDNEILDRAVATNIHGLLWTFKYTLPLLVEAAQGSESTSSIVTIGTAGTNNAVPGMPAYWATKAPVEVMTRSIAREFGARRVRVNCVSSGLVETESELSAMTPEFHEAVLAMNCLPYFGEPADIAAACAFLSSDDARYVTGATLAVDGGASA